VSTPNSGGGEKGNKKAHTDMGLFVATYAGVLTSSEPQQASQEPEPGPQQASQPVQGQVPAQEPEFQQASAGSRLSVPGKEPLMLQSQLQRSSSF
jgi:hypothetical protein